MKMDFRDIPATCNSRIWTESWLKQTDHKGRVGITKAWIFEMKIYWSRKGRTSDGRKQATDITYTTISYWLKNLLISKSPEKDLKAIHWGVNSGDLFLIFKICACCIF